MNIWLEYVENHWFNTMSIPDVIKESEDGR